LDIDREVEQRLIDRINRVGGQATVLLVSDYLKGTVTGAVMGALLSLKNAGAPLLVDPKIPHLELYAGASLITPNHQEAEAATHRRIRSDDEARIAALDFKARARCEAVLITRGEAGMWLSSDQTEGAVPALAREVADVTGAGDTVVATLALAVAAGATIVEAAGLANHAAGLVVGKFGPATVTRDELMATF
jgi:D-beta-D-heptose 7-phosphate kinase/D-beta-D-heptose 1-phosphate adenosyltransferase